MALPRQYFLLQPRHYLLKLHKTPIRLVVGEQGDLIIVLEGDEQVTRRPVVIAFSFPRLQRHEDLLVRLPLDSNGLVVNKPVGVLARVKLYLAIGDLLKPHYLLVQLPYFKADDRLVHGHDGVEVLYYGSVVDFANTEAQLVPVRVCGKNNVVNRASVHIGNMDGLLVVVSF